MILNMNDLKTIREMRRWTQQELAEATGLSQPHLVSIESGQLLPRKSTRQKITGILGQEIDWVSTLTRDKGHIGYALKELLNFQEPGVDERIRFCKQYLSALEKLTSKTNEYEQAEK